MKKYFLFSSLLLLIGCNIETDNLRISNEQLNKIQLLYNQADAQLDTDPERASKTAQKLLELTEALHHRAGIGDAHYLLGLAHDFQGKYDTAVYHHLLALNQRKELSDQLGKGKSYANLGIVYRRLGLTKEARECQEVAIFIWEDLANKKSEANAYHNLGLVEQDDRQYNKAEIAYKHSLYLYQQLGNKAKAARLYNDLAAVKELKSNDYSNSLAYYQQSLRLSSTDDQYGIGWLEGNIGRMYNKLHQPDSALTFLLRAKTKLENTSREKHTLVAVYNAIAESYTQKSDFPKAIEILEKAETLDKAVTGLFRKELADTYKLFQAVYKSQHNTAQVRHYQNKYQIVQEQLTNIKAQARIVQLESQGKVKDVEIAIAEERHQETIIKYSQTRIGLVVLCSILILLVWVIIVMYKKVRKYRNVALSILPEYGSDE